METKRKLHYTVRGMLALMTLVAAIAAFAANFPYVALIVGFLFLLVLTDLAILATVGAKVIQFWWAMVVALLVVGAFMLAAGTVIYCYRGAEAAIPIRNNLAGGGFCCALAALLAAWRWRFGSGGV